MRKRIAFVSQEIEQPELINTNSLLASTGEPDLGIYAG
jgi:hypothetical protein